ncbi:MAG: hypothetical protein K0S25_885 [Bacillus sp. (in: firmicutes)]|jgi:hypothetical protein|nr:hypothetical protein [Bacillus sp. (in: firmicutes)]
MYNRNKLDYLNGKKNDCQKAIYLSVGKDTMPVNSFVMIGNENKMNDIYGIKIPCNKRVEFGLYS